MFMSSVTEIVTCTHCTRSYYQRMEDQLPGAQICSPDKCPYCHRLNRKDAAHIYFNCKLDR